MHILVCMQCKLKNANWYWVFPCEKCKFLEVSVPKGSSLLNTQSYICKAIEIRGVGKVMKRIVIGHPKKFRLASVSCHCHVHDCWYDGTINFSKAGETSSAYSRVTRADYCHNLLVNRHHMWCDIQSHISIDAWPWPTSIGVRLPPYEAWLCMAMLSGMELLEWWST
jgi:hypothetical protein